MAQLHEALTSLSPIEWNSVPTDSLDNYLSDIFTQGELICNSVPPPLSGTPFQDAKPQFDTPNQATGWKDMPMSSARSHPSHEDHESLQKNWGKAMKFSQKENPLGIAVYKMAGHDRHGAWFARRSVHEGMGFNRFRHAMMREFPESLAVQGGPGEGNIRGIGGDQRLERKDVDGVGRMEVYQLSAQFPGPTTPREFITLLLTTDHGMTEKSVAQQKDGNKHVPRSYMIVSKPIKHPEAPERSGYIRGQYESVELVREIPLSHSKSKSTNNLLDTAQDSGRTGRDRGSTIGSAESRGPEAKGEQRDSKQTTSNSDEAELNPVEWIMITRSDPGGGIPRFMVDRGTPSALISDVHKWLDWAANLDETKDPEAVGPEEPADSQTGETSEKAPPATDGHAKQDSGLEAPRKSSTMPTPAQAQQQQEGGVVSHLTQAFGAGIDQYAPAAVSSYIHGSTQDDPAANDNDDSSSSDTSSISSSGSFMSASSMRRHSTAEPHSPGADSQLSLNSMSLEQLKQQKSLNSHEKEVLKLAKRRDTLDRKLAKKREDEEARLAKAREQEDGEKSKAQERYDRELQKSEAKHRREREKLEAKKEKEAQKAEAKRRKRDERDQTSRVARERDEFREEVGLLKREVEILHEQMGDLQRENTAMASRLGKLGSADALRGVKEETGRARAGSSGSVRSRDSGESRRGNAGGGPAV